MKRLTLENYSKLNHLSRLANYEEYNSNIVTMLMWNHYYKIYYELFDNYALILVEYPNLYAWLMPLCDKKYLKEAFESMKQYSFDHNIDFVVHGLTQDVKEYCELNDIHFIYECHPPAVRAHRHDHLPLRLQEPFRSRGCPL